MATFRAKKDLFYRVSADPSHPDYNKDIKIKKGDTFEPDARQKKGIDTMLAHGKIEEVKDSSDG
jgi:hypothetical protein